MTSNNKLLDLIIGDWEAFFCANHIVYKFDQGGIFFSVDNVLVGPMPAGVIQIYSNWQKKIFTIKELLANPRHNTIITNTFG